MQQGANAATPVAEKSPGSNDLLLARDIRALRRSRMLTLSELAGQIGRSVGWMSQVERGISQPSIADLRLLGEAFGVPISLFFAHEAASETERGKIVRAGMRRRLGSSESGLTEELLSPDLGGPFEMVRSIFAPGAAMQHPQTRNTEEAGYVVSGLLDLQIDGVWYHLGEGDSFRFRGLPYRWRNRSNAPAVVIWVVAPPVY